MLQVKAQELLDESAKGPSEARAAEMALEYQIVGAVNETYGPTYPWSCKGRLSFGGRSRFCPGVGGPFIQGLIQGLPTGGGPWMPVLKWWRWRDIGRGPLQGQLGVVEQHGQQRRGQNDKDQAAHEHVPQRASDQPP